ncbi:uncharacterized protein KIAA1671-like [Rhynchocyon petersi]
MANPLQKEGHGASALRSPWKPETLREKARQLEQKDSSNKDPEDCSRGNAVGSPCASNGPLEDDGHFETVWATVFEHHVERHSVADQSRRCLLATVPGDVPDTLLAESKPRPDRVSWLGRPLLDRTNPKKESSRRPENPEAEKMGQTALLNGDPKQYQPTLHLGEKCNNGPFQKHPESQPVAQRVEPKYDIMHTVGTRAHSQAVCVAQEEKAVSLRSSMAGLSQESHMSPEVTGPSPVSSLDGQPWSVQRASLLWEARGLPKPDWKEAKDVSGRGCSSPKWTGRPSVSWNKTTVVHGEEKGSVLNLPGSCMAEAPLVRMVKTSIQEVQAEEFGGAGSKAEGCVSRDQRKETLRKSAGSGDDRSGVHWGDYPRDSGSLQLDIKRACSEKGPPAHIQEGRSIMQEARERKREQAKGRPGFPRDSLEAKQTKPEPCWHESGARDGHKILPRDPGKEEGAQDNEQPIRRLSHATPGPRRSHSFCKDRRSGPLVGPALGNRRSWGPGTRWSGQQPPLGPPARTRCQLM